MKKLLWVLGLVSLMATQLAVTDYSCVQCNNGASGCRQISTNPREGLRAWCKDKGGARYFYDEDDRQGVGFNKI